MPIRIEQPQPFLPYAAAGSAAVEEQRRQHQQQMQDAHFQQQQFEYFNRPNQIAQVQAQAYQQRLDFDRQHIRQEFSTADQIELDRMKNGRAAVDKQLREGSIDEDTANGYYKALEVPIGVLQQRRAYNQTKQEEEQTKRLMHQNAQMKKMEEMDLNVSASNPQAVQPHYLPGQSPQDVGDDGEPLGARAVPVGFAVHEIDASGRTKRVFHPFKPPPSAKDTQYGPPKQEFDEDGNPLPGLHQRGPDGRLHLVPTGKAEAQPVTPILGMGTKAGISGHDIYGMIKEEEKHLTELDAEKHSQPVGAGRTFLGADGKEAATTGTTEWHMMPREEIHAEAERRVRARLSRMTGGAQATPAAPPAATPTQTAAAGIPPGPPPGVDYQSIGAALMQAASK